MVSLHSVPVLTSSLLVASLQASYIRNSILKSSPTIHKDDLLNLVYTHPTIEGLAKFLARPGDSGVGDPKELMFALVRKYTQDLPRPIVRNAFYSTSEEVFLLTGSTGALGAHLLHRLLHMESVKRVYVLNRSGSTPTKMRQERAFSTLGLDSTGLSSSKLEYLDVNYIESKFGVGEAKYQELTESLTCIIHNGTPTGKESFTADLCRLGRQFQSLAFLDGTAASRDPESRQPRTLLYSCTQVSVHQLRRRLCKYVVFFLASRL